MKEMTIKEVQQVSLEILKDVHEFCVENDIHYSLSGGTLLGAIRHNGFIPWDDDIDIQLPRPDYDRFIHTYKSKRGYKLFSQEIEGEKNVAYSWTRVCDMQRTLVDSSTLPWCAYEVGVWIDVLPCDGMPNNEKEAKSHLMKIKRLTLISYWRGIKSTPYLTYKKGKNRYMKIKFLCKKLLLAFINANWLTTFDKLTKARKKYDYKTCDYFFVIPHYGMREWQPKKNMESFILHRFEDAEFYIMSGYDANLRSLYGDYMKLPPKNKRVTHDYNRYYWK